MERIVEAIETLIAIEFRVERVGSQIGNGLTIMLLFATLLYIDA